MRLLSRYLYSNHSIIVGINGNLGKILILLLFSFFITQDKYYVFYLNTANTKKKKK